MATKKKKVKPSSASVPERVAVVTIPADSSLEGEVLKPHRCQSPVCAYTGQELALHELVGKRVRDAYRNSRGFLVLELVKS